MKTKFLLTAFAVFFSLFSVFKTVWVDITSNLSEWLDNKFSYIHFGLWGNNFISGIFWLPAEDLAEKELVNIEWVPSAWERKCLKRVRWIYFNSVRWLRLFPLDLKTQDMLWALWTWYDTLDTEWWFYTACEGDVTWIYGVIKHRVNWYDRYLVSGTKYDILGNKYDPTDLVKSFEYFNWSTPLWYMFDSAWWIWFVWWNMITWSEIILTAINNWESINEIFSIDNAWDIVAKFSWVDKIPKELRGTWLDTTSKIDVEWNVMSSLWSVDNANVQTLSSNKKLVVVNNKVINISQVLGRVKKNANQLCQGAWVTENYYNSRTPKQNTVCINSSREFKINTTKSSFNSKFSWRSIVMKWWWNVVIQWGSMSEWQTMEIFVDEWNIIIEDMTPDVWFDVEWNPVPLTSSDAVTSGTNLIWIFIANWLVLGRSSNGNVFEHKMYIRGQMVSLSTLWRPKDERKDHVKNVIWTINYNNYKDNIDLTKVFTWSCDVTNWRWTDNAWCDNINDKYRYNSLILVFKKIAWRLLK